MEMRLLSREELQKLDDGGQGLHIHPMFQSIGSENVPQVVKAYLFTSSVLQVAAEKERLRAESKAG